MNTLYQVLLGLGTLAAMWVATRVTLKYAHRPDGMINQYGQSQAVVGGQVQVYDPSGLPVSPRPMSFDEKPLWIIWGQMFIVSELAVLLVVFILTGGFGLFNALGL